MAGDEGPRPDGATGFCCFRLVLGAVFFFQKRGHPAAPDAKPF